MVKNDKIYDIQNMIRGALVGVGHSHSAKNLKELDRGKRMR